MNEETDESKKYEVIEDLPGVGPSTAKENQQNTK